MLLGGDYTDGVKGVGIVNAMEVLEAFEVHDLRAGLTQFKKWLEVGMDLSGMAQQSLTRLNPFQAFFDQFPESKPPSDEKGNED